MGSAKWIVALVAVFNFGGYVADAVIPFTAKQHVHNPRWPPHAKFHNGHTMLLGIGLGLYSLFLLFGTGNLTLLHFYLAAVSASLYFVAMLLSPIRNRSQALALCSSHLHAVAPDNNALLTEPQTSALNRSWISDVKCV